MAELVSRDQDAALAARPQAGIVAFWFFNQGILKMAPGFKTGGRVKGSRNKAVLAREAAMAEAAKLLQASDGDKFDGERPQAA